MEYVVREAVSADLPTILSLYGQPDIDDGKVMDLETANAVFRRIGGCPNYRLFVASGGGCVVGTYALVILDNLAHGGTIRARGGRCRSERLASKGGWQSDDQPCHESLP